MLNISSLNRIFRWVPLTPGLTSGRVSSCIRWLLSSVLCGVTLFSFASPSSANPSFANLAAASSRFVSSDASPTLAILPVIVAQIDAAQAPITQAFSPQADVAAEKVDQFAQAYLQVLQLLSDRESEIPTAKTTAEALKIEQSIETDAVNIIQSSGLTMPEYMQILGLASQDAALQAKVLSKMDKSAKDSQ